MEVCSVAAVWYGRPTNGVASWQGPESRVETEGLRAGQTTVNMDYPVIITYRTLGKRTARERNNMAGGETGHDTGDCLEAGRSPFHKSKKAKTAVQGGRDRRLRR
ncbi:hypothetical protein BDW68DRAFT_71936 [Aspergillus falconensis]